MQTHEVFADRQRQVVIKRYVQNERGEAAREWRALTLLAAHAPGLAPEPVRADLTATPPVVEMSLLPGEPLGGVPLTAEQERGLVRALRQLWESVPAAAVFPVHGETGQVEQLLTRIRDLDAIGRDPGDDRVVRLAMAEGRRWLQFATDGGTLRIEPGDSETPFALGQGDAYLANFLWDGERVRIVDFEDSGASDRPFELAVLVEHISAWHECGLDGDGFAAAFGLSATESARLAEGRRLAALFWLLMLMPGGRASRRNPPGTLQQQAERVLALL